ncbi:hypothetical protein BB559_006861 [Furculomyces boomerangus]|uniref:Uncharacterized protein n=1 Tax=Furculomyces boomerangus TaxID=61424 RepID=A0A2T9Y056_9FUNG|nr:hypothetical protein BB559_006861 [Furculomyces boomerangus]
MNSLLDLSDSIFTNSGSASTTGVLSNNIEYIQKLNGTKASLSEKLTPTQSDIVPLVKQIMIDSSEYNILSTKEESILSKDLERTNHEINHLTTKIAKLKSNIIPNIAGTDIKITPKDLSNEKSAQMFILISHLESGLRKKFVRSLEISKKLSEHKISVLRESIDYHLSSPELFYENRENKWGDAISNRPEFFGSSDAIKNDMFIMKKVHESFLDFGSNQPNKESTSEDSQNNVRFNRKSGSFDSKSKNDLESYDKLALYSQLNRTKAELNQTLSNLDSLRITYKIEKDQIEKEYKNQIKALEKKIQILLGHVFNNSPIAYEIHDKNLTQKIIEASTYSGRKYSTTEPFLQKSKKRNVNERPGRSSFLLSKPSISTPNKHTKSHYNKPRDIAALKKRAYTIDKYIPNRYSSSDILNRSISFAVNNRVRSNTMVSINPTSENKRFSKMKPPKRVASHYNKRKHFKIQKKPLNLLGIHGNRQNKNKTWSLPPTKSDNNHIFQSQKSLSTNDSDILSSSKINLRAIDLTKPIDLLSRGVRYLDNRSLKPEPVRLLSSSSAINNFHRISFENIYTNLNTVNMKISYKNVKGKNRKMSADIPSRLRINSDGSLLGTDKASNYSFGDSGTSVNKQRTTIKSKTKNQLNSPDSINNNGNTSPMTIVLFKGNTHVLNKNIASALKQNSSRPKKHNSIYSKKVFSKSANSLLKSSKLTGEKYQEIFKRYSLGKHPLVTRKSLDNYISNFLAQNDINDMNTAYRKLSNSKNHFLWNGNEKLDKNPSKPVDNIIPIPDITTNKINISKNTANTEKFTNNTSTYFETPLGINNNVESYQKNTRNIFVSTMTSINMPENTQQDSAKIDHNHSNNKTLFETKSGDNLSNERNTSVDKVSGTLNYENTFQLNERPLNSFQSNTLIAETTKSGSISSNATVEPLYSSKNNSRGSKNYSRGNQKLVVPSLTRSFSKRSPSNSSQKSERNNFGYRSAPGTKGSYDFDKSQLPANTVTSAVQFQKDQSKIPVPTNTAMKKTELSTRIQHQIQNKQVIHLNQLGNLDDYNSKPIEQEYEKEKKYTVQSKSLVEIAKEKLARASYQNFNGKTNSNSLHSASIGRANIPKEFEKNGSVNLNKQYSDHYLKKTSPVSEINFQNTEVLKRVNTKNENSTIDSQYTSVQTDISNIDKNENTRSLDKRTNSSGIVDENKSESGKQDDPPFRLLKKNSSFMAKLNRGGSSGSSTNKNMKNVHLFLPTNNQPPINSPPPVPKKNNNQVQNNISNHLTKNNQSPAFRVLGKNNTSFTESPIIPPSGSIDINSSFDEFFSPQDTGGIPTIGSYFGSSIGNMNQTPRPNLDIENNPIQNKNGTFDLKSFFNQEKEYVDSQQTVTKSNNSKSGLVQNTNNKTNSDHESKESQQSKQEVQIFLEVSDGSDIPEITGVSEYPNDDTHIHKIVGTAQAPKSRKVVDKVSSFSISESLNYIKNTKLENSYDTAAGKKNEKGYNNNSISNTEPLNSKAPQNTINDDKKMKTAEQRNFSSNTKKSAFSMESKEKTIASASPLFVKKPQSTLYSTSIISGTSDDNNSRLDYKTSDPKLYYPEYASESLQTISQISETNSEINTSIESNMVKSSFGSFFSKKNILNSEPSINNNNPSLMSRKNDVKSAEKARTPLSVVRKNSEVVRKTSNNSFLKSIKQRNISNNSTGVPFKNISGVDNRKISVLTQSSISTIPEANTPTVGGPNYNASGLVPVEELYSLPSGNSLEESSYFRNIYNNYSYIYNESVPNTVSKNTHINQKPNSNETKSSRKGVKRENDWSDEIINKIDSMFNTNEVTKDYMLKRITSFSKTPLVDKSNPNVLPIDQFITAKSPLRENLKMSNNEGNNNFNKMEKSGLEQKRLEIDTNWDSKMSKDRKLSVQHQVYPNKNGLVDEIEKLKQSSKKSLNSGLSYGNHGQFYNNGSIEIENEVMMTANSSFLDLSGEESEEKIGEIEGSRSWFMLHRRSKIKNKSPTKKNSFFGGNTAKPNKLLKKTNSTSSKKPILTNKKDRSTTIDLDSRNPQTEHEGKSNPSFKPKFLSFFDSNNTKNRTDQLNNRPTTYDYSQKPNLLSIPNANAPEYPHNFSFDYKKAIENKNLGEKDPMYNLSPKSYVTFDFKSIPILSKPMPENNAVYKSPNKSRSRNHLVWNSLQSRLDGKPVPADKPRI